MGEKSCPEGDKIDKKHCPRGVKLAGKLSKGGRIG